jgi:stress-induced morphogen
MTTAGLVYNYNEEAGRVLEALRKDFPTDTIDTSEGYNGRVHLKVVSRRFNGMSEPEKQKYIWDLLRDRLGEGAQAVSLALVYGTDEL